MTMYSIARDVTQNISEVGGWAKPVAMLHHDIIPVRITDLQMMINLKMALLYNRIEQGNQKKSSRTR